MEELAIDKRKGLSIKKSFLVLIFYFILSFFLLGATESILSLLKTSGMNTKIISGYVYIIVETIMNLIFISVYKQLTENELRFSNTIKVNKYIFVALIIIGYRFIYGNTLSLIMDKIITNSWYNEAIKKELENLPSFFIGALIIAPIFEEILCRGILLEGLLLRNKPYISIVISASMFSLMHRNLVQIPNTFFMGLIIGWVYYKTRSVIPCIFAHFINNLLPTILYCNPKLYNDGKFNVITLIMGMIFFIGSVWGLKNGVE